MERQPQSAPRDLSSFPPALRGVMETLPPELDLPSFGNVTSGGGVRRDYYNGFVRMVLDTGLSEGPQAAARFGRYSVTAVLRALLEMSADTTLRKEFDTLAEEGRKYHRAVKTNGGTGDAPEGEYGDAVAALFELTAKFVANKKRTSDGSRKRRE